MKYDASGWLTPIEMASGLRQDEGASTPASALQPRRAQLSALQARVDRLENELEHLKELLATVGCSVGSLLGTLERDLGSLYCLEDEADKQ